MAAHNLHELHLGPEVEEVKRQTSQNDPAQYEHVLRRPVHARLGDGHFVTLRAARLVVVVGEPQGVGEVDQYAGGQHDRTCQRIPVSAQKRADHVIAFGRDDCDEVHGHVEEDEQHEKTTRNAHYQFLAKRRIGQKTAHNV